jgi:hypothetical protein
MKKKLTKSFICSVAVYVSEIWTLGKNEEWVVNEFENVELEKNVKNKMDG